MIKATIRQGEQAVRLEFENGGKVRLTGDPGLASRVDAVLQPGSTSYYNPRKGGRYRGFDPTDPVEILDGLAMIGKWATVDVDHDHDQAIPPVPFLGTADGTDPADEGRWRAMEPGPWERFTALDQGRRPPMQKARIVIRKLWRKGQLGLFSADTQERVAQANAAAKEGVGEQHTVHQHFAANPHGGGVHVVQEHQRAGLGHQVKPLVLTPPPQPDEAGRVKHHDTGAKIKGSRKEKWASIHWGNLQEAEDEGEARKLVDKAHVFGDYNGDLDRMLGDTAGASWLKKKLLAAVGARPADTPQARAAYVSAADWLKKELTGCHTAEEVYQFVKDWGEMARGNEPAGDLTLGEALEKYGTIHHNDPPDPERMAELRARGQGNMADFYERRYRETPWEKRIDWKKLKADGFDGGHSTYEIANGTHRVRLYKRGSMGLTYRRHAETLGGNVWTIVKGYTSGRGRPAWYDEKEEAVRRQREGDWSGLTSDAPAAKKERDPNERQDTVRTFTPAVDKAQRVGGPQFRGEVTGDKLREKFGFRGIQFGNWVDDDDAGKHLTLAYGAFLDLADLLGLEPRQVCHGKQLGIAFGARGGGWASAHYEPDQVTINLTHTRGGGTIAHEWFHFFDHILTGLVTAKGEHVEAKPGAWVQDGGRLRSTMLTHTEGQSAVDPEVYEAVQGIVRAMSGGDDFEKERRKLGRQRKEVMDLHRAGNIQEARRKQADYETAVQDYNARFRAAGRRQPKRSQYAIDCEAMGGYWARPHEMAARAFESWAEDKLESQGRKNTYLVSGTRRKYGLVKGERFDIEPYPQGEDRERINAAIDNLVEVMRTSAPLRKALEQALEQGPQGFHRGALVTSAALTDHHAQAHGKRMAELRGRLEREIAATTSPLRKAELQASLYELDEAAGALRYSAVTGHDDSDLPRKR